MRYLAAPDQNFVLTNELLKDSRDDNRYYREVLEVAEQRCSRLLPVLLRCDAEELLRRVALPQRRERGKEVSPESLVLRMEEFAL